MIQKAFIGGLRLRKLIHQPSLLNLLASITRKYPLKKIITLC